MENPNNFILNFRVTEIQVDDEPHSAKIKGTAPVLPAGIVPFVIQLKLSQDNDSSYEGLCKVKTTNYCYND